MSRKDPTESRNTEARSSARHSGPPMRRNIIEPIHVSAIAERTWNLEQEKIERERSEAWNRYPPGSTLNVTTARGISRRGRAGVTFTDKGRTTVEVVNLDDEQIARVRSLTEAELDKLNDGGIDELDGVDRATAVRLRQEGAALVSPMGAKAIADDDGLTVFGEGNTDAAAAGDEKDRRIAELEAENKTLRDKLTAANRKAGNPAAPTRLGQGAGEFGGEGEPK